MKRHDLMDEQCALIESLVPANAARTGRKYTLIQFWR